MNEFTCKDCKHYINMEKEQSWCSSTGNACNSMCEHFETRNGSRTRFCRLASDIEELVQMLIEVGYNEKGEEGWYFVKDPTRLFFDRRIAEGNARACLMEVEE